MKENKHSMTALKLLESSLPPGITIRVTTGGTLTYVVRSSYSTPVGMQVKVSLGTFTDVGEAIKKLFEFKFTHAIKGIRSELLAEAANEVMRKHMGIFDEKKAVILEAAEKTVDELRASNEWAIIASLPPHEIPLTGDYRYFDESTGQTTIVNERFIAAYHRALEKLWSGEAKTADLASEQPQPEQQMEEKIAVPEDSADAVFASWKQ